MVLRPDSLLDTFTTESLSNLSGKWDYRSHKEGPAEKKRKKIKKKRFSSSFLYRWWWACRQMLSLKLPMLPCFAIFTCSLNLILDSEGFGAILWNLSSCLDSTTGWSKTTAPWLHGSAMVNLISYMFRQLHGILSSYCYTASLLHEYILCLLCLILSNQVYRAGTILFHSDSSSGPLDFFLGLCYCYD